MKIKSPKRRDQIDWGRPKPMAFVPEGAKTNVGNRPMGHPPISYEPLIDSSDPSTIPWQQKKE
jgi:hypothetical protein